MKQKIKKNEKNIKIKALCHDEPHHTIHQIHLVKHQNTGNCCWWAWRNQKCEHKMTGKTIIATAIGVSLGAIIGYLYYMEIGCLSGTCAITSKPLNSTLYGSFMGGLLFNIFIKNPEK